MTDLEKLLAELAAKQRSPAPINENPFSPQQDGDFEVEPAENVCGVPDTQVPVHEYDPNRVPRNFVSQVGNTGNMVSAFICVTLLCAVGSYFIIEFFVIVSKIR